MPKFQYLAKKSPTETVEGTLEAKDRTNVITHLTGLGYTPIRVAPVQEAKTKSGTPGVAVPSDIQVPYRHLNQFTRQFASLIRSQVPILRCLGILKEQATNLKLQRVIRAVEEDIRQGQTLSTAMAKYPRVFSLLYLSLIHSGEVGGMLDTVLDRLVVQAEREEALVTKVQTSLAYPLFVAGVGFCTVIFLLTFVIPRLVKLFSVFGTRLPLPTRILLALAAGISKGWFWIVGVLFAVLFLSFLLVRREEGRIKIDSVTLHLPLIGPLVRQLEITRFARSFGLLLDQGVPILQATDVAIPVVKNRVLRKELMRLPAHLKDGNPISTGLKGMGISTPFFVNTVAVGVESGKVGEALLEVANFYENEVGRLLEFMTSLLEPVTILIVGGVVGFIVLAVLLPILTMGLIAR